MTLSMRRATQIARRAAVVLALAIPLAALAASRGGESSAAPAAAPSFTRDVAPIIAAEVRRLSPARRHRAVPARDGEADLVARGLIAAAVQAGLMPPWPPGGRSPSYVGEQERKLSAAERATILAWARAGGKVDGPARKPLRQRSRSQVAPGESRPRRCGCPRRTGRRAAKGVTDDYRCFLLDPKRAGDASVTSARIEPGAAEGRPPRDPLPRRASAGRATRSGSTPPQPGRAGRASAERGFPRRRAGSIQDSLNDANWVAAWAPGWGGNRLPEGTGVPLPGRQPDRDAGALQPAERPHSRPLARAPHRRARVGEAHAAADDAPSRRPSSSRARRASRVGSATATRRCSSLAGKYGPRPRSSRPGSSSSAAATRRTRARARSRPATGGSRSRRRSTSRPGTCTSSAPRSGSS